MDKGPMLYYADWGMPGDLLEFAGVAVETSGNFVLQVMLHGRCRFRSRLVQVLYSTNSLFSVGIVCGVKRLRVFNRHGQQVPSSPSFVLLPQQRSGWR